MILDDVDAYLGRFVAFPSPEARHAVTLWAAHTHCFDCFDSTPRLVLTSPEKQSGKTRCLEVLDLIAANTISAGSISRAALVRSLAEQPTPTVLLDEYDTVFGDRPTDGSEDLRGIINNGHRAGMDYIICVPPKWDRQAFPVYAPIALAGIGHLPDTVVDRSVLITMRRQAPGERAEQFRRRPHEPPGIELGERLAAWVGEISHKLDGYEPDNPLEDRAADVWEPLLAIAEHAGPDWAARARTAALSLTGRQDAPESQGVELLRDIRTIWPSEEPTLAAAELVRLLRDVEEMRWAEYRGNGLNPRSLSQFLRPFGITSHKKATANVYARSDLSDAWDRYLEPPTPSVEPPQGPQDPTMEELEEMDLLREEREQDTADAILF